MDTIPLEKLSVYFEPEDRETAERAAQTAERTLQLLKERWGIEPPADLRVYIMTSWQGFMFGAAPPLWKLYMALTFPLWAPRTVRIWPIAGGWAQAFGKRHTVGVKPPRLIAKADRSIGLQIFEPLEPMERVEMVTCHELTHACTNYLRSPAWLHEGMAMVMVDLCLGKPTVQQGTLAHLANAPAELAGRPNTRRIARTREGMIYQYTRGYWLTRFLSESQPELLRSLLGRHRSHPELIAELAAGLGLTSESFWEQIDGLVVAHLSKREAAQDI